MIRLGMVGEALVQNEGTGWKATEWSQNQFWGGYAAYEDHCVTELASDSVIVVGDCESTYPLRVYADHKQVGLIGPRPARALLDAGWRVATD